MKEATQSAAVSTPIFRGKLSSCELFRGDICWIRICGTKHRLRLIGGRLAETPENSRAFDGKVSAMVVCTREEFDHELPVST